MPITSYFKLIDWWLFTLFNLLVLTLGFHTYLSHVILKSTKQQKVRKVQLLKKHRNCFRRCASIQCSAFYTMILLKSCFYLSYTSVYKPITRKNMKSINQLKITELFSLCQFNLWYNTYQSTYVIALCKSILGAISLETIWSEFICIIVWAFIQVKYRVCTV